MMLDYTSIPFRAPGRDFSGADCYGIVLLYFKNELGIKLLDYQYATSEESEKMGLMLESAHNDFEPIDLKDVKKNDIVVMCRGGATHPNHCGVMVDDYRLMQTTERHGCVVTRFSSLQNLHSAYRHKGVPK